LELCVVYMHSRLATFTHDGCAICGSTVVTPYSIQRVLEETCASPGRPLQHWPPNFLIAHPYTSKINYHAPPIEALYLFLVFNYKCINHIRTYTFQETVHYIGAIRTWFSFFPYPHGTSRAPHSGEHCSTELSLL